jgi:hypothetical protein
LRLCYFIAPSLTRGRVCNLMLLLVLASASPRDSRPYFIVPILETPPTWKARSRIYISQEQLEIEVTLRPTVSRPVRLGVLEQVTRCYIYLSENYFLYFLCRAPSLTRGRVCNLQCNDASSVSSYIATDGLSAISSWCRAPSQRSRSKSHYDRQSAGRPSWCQAPIWDPRPIFLSP